MNCYRIITALLFFITYQCHAQTLHYFINPADSLWGVKESTGKKIIPAKYDVSPLYLEQKKPITDSIIIFPVWGRGRHDFTSWSWGDAYDRKGNFLYHPMTFDNWADFFSEGFSRCVENGKAGFVNIKGVMAIKPQWDWVSPFNYGYAAICNDCYWDTGKDKEHPPLAFRDKWFPQYINFKGEIVTPADKPSSGKDQLLENGKYLPYPFSYNYYEQQLVDSINKLEVLSKIQFMNYYPEQVTGKEAKLQFEITGRPLNGWPYYTLQGYSYSKSYGFMGEDKMEFLVHIDGTMYNYYSFSNITTPYMEWLNEKLQECKEFFNNHPDAPNKFDVDKYIRETRK